MDPARRQWDLNKLVSAAACVVKIKGVPLIPAHCINIKWPAA